MRRLRPHMLADTTPFANAPHPCAAGRTRKRMRASRWLLAAGFCRAPSWYSDQTDVSRKSNCLGRVHTHSDSEPLMRHYTLKKREQSSAWHE